MRQKNPKAPVTELLIWGIPAKLKAQFKTACAKNNTTMRDAVIRGMERFLREPHV